jgi:hypothetical protein
LIGYPAHLPASSIASSSSRSIHFCYHHHCHCHLHHLLLLISSPHTPPHPQPVVVCMFLGQCVMLFLLFSPACSISSPSSRSMHVSKHPYFFPFKKTFFFYFFYLLQYLTAAGTLSHYMTAIRGAFDSRVDQTRSMRRHGEIGL